LQVRKLTTTALLSAIALTIFMVEAQIPAPVPVPGIKLGLANIVTVYTVYALGAREGAAVLFVRILLGAVFSGNFSTVFYSAGGGLLAILTTIGLKKLLRQNQIWICSCLGAIAHSIGQMAVAVWITGTPSLLIYLPVLILCSILTGSFTGLCAQLLLKRGKDLWKTIFK
jgi:heptaprenyl diphosphate synthase